MSEQGPFAHWQEAIQPRDEDKEQPPTESGTLPPLFQFSQNSLQDYADCARRFQLRYIDGLRWPAPEIEPIEEHEEYMERGTEFHLLVQRHILGIPEEQLTPHDPDLLDWWDAYLQFPPPDLPSERRVPEIQMTVPFGEHRLLAKFDLLAIDPGERAVIVDWKTTRSRPARDTLARRLQTRVYPYVLAEAGGYLFGEPLRPDQITLVYWFANDPMYPETFPYTNPQHEDNRGYLQSLIDEILLRGEENWPLTDETFHCKYCIYRSLCDRGITAGHIDDPDSEVVELDVDFDFEFEFDEIDEIAF